MQLARNMNKTGRDFWFTEVNPWATAKAITSDENNKTYHKRRVTVFFHPELGIGGHVRQVCPGC